MNRGSKHLNETLVMVRQKTTVLVYSCVVGHILGKVCHPLVPSFHSCEVKGETLKSLSCGALNAAMLIMDGSLSKYTSLGLFQVGLITKERDRERITVLMLIYSEMQAFSNVSKVSSFRLSFAVITG